MRRYDSNLGFLDLLFNLLLGFAALFILALILINPVEKNGVVDPPVQMQITMEWADTSSRDIDLHLNSPTGHVSFIKKDGGNATLERDDLGSRSDYYIVNGEQRVVKRNYEIINITDLPAGEYVVNAQYYSRMGDAEKVKIKVTNIHPYKEVYTGVYTLTPRQSHTFVSFIIDSEGQITDIRDDIQIPIIYH